MTTVLLVDDSECQRKLGRLYLEDAGFTVEDAANAADALEAARRQRPDVIVSDVMMDTIDGFGFCRRVRDDATLAAIPVVLVSAHYDDHVARKLATTLGAYALIQRTPDFSAEIAAIDACLSAAPRASQRLRRESYEAHLEANAHQLSKLLDDTQRAERRWRTLFEQAHDTVALITPDGVIAEANQRWETVIGIPPRDLIGHDGFEYAAPEFVETAKAMFRAALAGELSSGVILLRHANGSTVHLEVTLSLVEVDGVAHLMAIGRDITERVTAERQIAEAEAQRRHLEEHLAHTQRLETIGQMTGSIAHDFNNILSAIMLSSELMLEELAVGDPRRADAEDIRTATTRAAALTKQLLAFSRKQVLELVELDLSTVVDSASRIVRRLLGKSIDLRIEDTTDHARVCADLVQLEQVIVNLAVNARDAMPGGGTLTIRTSTVESSGDRVPRGTYLLLSVIDTGCGMSPETQKRVFEPFFTTKPRGDGTGLGLSTSFGIVKQLGGEILVQSQVGHGTTMQVYLPRV